MGSHRHSTTGDILVLHVAGDSKITQFDLAIRRQEQIAWLQVAMDDAMIMSELECRTELSSLTTLSIADSKLECVCLPPFARAALGRGNVGGALFLSTGTDVAR